MSEIIQIKENIYLTFYVKLTFFKSLNPPSQAKQNIYSRLSK